MDIINLLLMIIIGGLISGVIIWIVSKLGLGLSVDGFLTAFIAAIIIAMIGGLVDWLLGALSTTIVGGWLGVILHFIVGAVVLLISDRLLKGFHVAGFVGALIAAIAIAVFDFLLGWLLLLLFA